MYYSNGLAKIIHADCREVSLGDITAVVTDPPYELGFMGKAWDKAGVSFKVETWKYLRSLCLSGAPLLSFGGTRTFHRIAVAIEDAGWEIRDTIMWVYGSGFPKSLDIGKAVDKLQGNEREVVGTKRAGFGNRNGKSDAEGSVFLNSLPEELKHISSTRGTSVWEGYGTALKPAYEPIILGMNPLEGTFAENALKHRVAGLNIDQCRIPTTNDDRFGGGGLNSPHRGFMANTPNTYQRGMGFRDDTRKGRFPANFIHDGSQMVMELFPETKSGNLNTGHKRGKTDFYGGGIIQRDYGGDNGSAARFFYTAKSSKAERGEGNSHPTVKPLALMEYLVKLVKMPEYNLILDPFMGSGTTLLACIKLGIPCIGIDNDEHTCEIAAKRCESWTQR